jgi:hypothetical protein
MKAFVIFPSISVFIITLTIFRIKNLPLVWGKRALLSLVVAFLFALLMVFTIEYLFMLVYYFNLICVILLIPSLSYLAYKYFNHFLPTHYIIKLIVLSIISTLLILMIFGFSVFISILFNPMTYM